MTNTQRISPSFQIVLDKAPIEIRKKVLKNKNKPNVELLVKYAIEENKIITSTMFQVAMVMIIGYQEVDNRVGRYPMDILNNLCNACGAKPTVESEILLMKQLKDHYRESALFHISRAQRIMEAVL